MPVWWPSRETTAWTDFVEAPAIVSKQSSVRTNETMIAYLVHAVSIEC